MLYANDRFVFKSGSCSFRSPKGTRIEMNDHVSWSRPKARIDPSVVDVFADQLSTALQCGIEVMHTSDGFSLLFKDQPRPDNPCHISILLHEIRERCLAADPTCTPPYDILPLINTDGRDAVCWLLSTLFDATYMTKASVKEIAWYPRRALPGGPSLPPQAA